MSFDIEFIWIFTHKISHQNIEITKKLVHKTKIKYIIEMNRDFLALIIVLGLSLAVNAKVDASLNFHTCQIMVYKMFFKLKFSRI